MSQIKGTHCLSHILVAWWTPYRVFLIAICAERRPSLNEAVATDRLALLSLEEVAGLE